MTLLNAILATLFVCWWFVGASKIALLDPSVRAHHTSTRNVGLLLALGPAAWLTTSVSTLFDLLYPPHIAITLEAPQREPSPTIKMKIRRESVLKHADLARRQPEITP